MPSLDEFLKTGRLGPIATGCSRDEVRALLGEPDAVSDRKSPEIWKYGPLQLAFYRQGPDADAPLTSITLYFRDPDDTLPDALAVSGWMPTGETTFQEFRDHLSDQGIVVAGGVTSGPGQYLVLGPSVRVTFDQGRLDSISSTARREPEVQQLTVTVPRADLDAIRLEARERGISVSALCSLWIGERVASRQAH